MLSPSQVHHWDLFALHWVGQLVELHVVKPGTKITIK